MTEYKVLIPLDGSRLAETSLAYLAYLKRFGGLRVTLISVTEANGNPSALRCYLRAVGDNLRSRLGLPVELKVPTGEPVSCILDAAASVSPDLMIMTTHGWSGINRLRHGSVSDQVLREIDCAVLSVGPNVLGRIDWVDDESRGPLSRILVPLDGSKLAEAALPLAHRIANVFDSEVHFVRVVPEAALVEAALASQYNEADSLLYGARDYIKGIAAHSGVASHKTVVLPGNPIESLFAYVKEQDIDLVVMTSHGRSGLARAAHGSVTDRMIRGPAPILVVPNRMNPD